MRSRRSEDSFVGRTTRSCSSASLVAAAAASSTGAEGEAVEEDRTAVYGRRREEPGLREGNPSREMAAAAGRWSGGEGQSARRWGWERSKGAEGAAIWPGDAELRERVATVP